jgi:hypothetical protein
MTARSTHTTSPADNWLSWLRQPTCTILVTLCGIIRFAARQTGSTSRNQSKREPICVLILVLFATSVFVHAQEQVGAGPDIDPFGSYQHGSLDKVNLANGQISLSIPLLSYPQKGKLQLGFGLYLGGRGWGLAYDQPTAKLAWAYQGSGVVVAPNHWLTGGVEYGGSCEPNIQPPTEVGGAAHPITFTQPAQCSQGGVAETVDGSGIRMDLTTITDKNGVKYTARAMIATSSPFATQIDPDGNKISYSFQSQSYTDSIGRQIPFPPYVDSLLHVNPPQGGDSTGCSGPIPIRLTKTWSIPAINNTVSTYKFCYVLIQVTSSFNFQSYADFTASKYSAQIPGYLFLQSLVLPDGRTWTFEYGSSPGDPPNINYGDLTKVTLPSGGTVSYTYANTSPCSTPTAGFYVGQGGVPNRYVTSRTEDPINGAPTHVWHYSWPHAAITCEEVGGPPYINNITRDPDGNETEHWFSDLYDNWDQMGNPGLTWPRSEVRTDIFQGLSSQNVLLETMTRDWSTKANGGNRVNGPAFPVRDTIQLADGLVSKKEFAYDLNLAASQGTVFASYGNLTEERLYAFGNGAAGPLQTRFVFAYHAFADASYLTSNMLDLLDYKQTFNSIGTTKVGELDIGFDENNGSPRGVLGHATSVSQWLDSNNTFVKSNVVLSSIHRECL